jgi:hypothetical protein
MTLSLAVKDVTTGEVFTASARIHAVAWRDPPVEPRRA